jgi:hypothetical protein
MLTHRFEQSYSILQIDCRLQEIDVVVLAGAVTDVAGKGNDENDRKFLHSLSLKKTNKF